jgi:hypothetical protein
LLQPGPHLALDYYSTHRVSRLKRLKKHDLEMGWLAASPHVTRILSTISSILPVETNQRFSRGKVPMLKSLRWLPIQLLEEIYS